MGAMGYAGQSITMPPPYLPLARRLSQFYGKVFGKGAILCYISIVVARNARLSLVLLFKSFNT